MLEQQELDRINKTFSDLKKAENEVVAIEAEVGVIKKQAKEIFTKYGLTGFGDIDKLKETLNQYDVDFEMYFAVQKRYFKSVYPMAKAGGFYFERFDGIV